MVLGSGCIWEGSKIDPVDMWYRDEFQDEMRYNLYEVENGTAQG